MYLCISPVLNKTSYRRDFALSVVKTHDVFDVHGFLGYRHCCMEEVRGGEERGEEERGGEERRGEGREGELS